MKYENYIQRFNDSIYEVYLAEKHTLKEEFKDEVRNLRSASESISQSLELALKAFLDSKLTQIEKKFISPRAAVPELIEFIVKGSGSKGDYYHYTIDDTITPSVDFNFLKSNKGVLTNFAKHNGDEPKKNIIEKYIVETRKFIREYLDNKAVLKTIDDFQNQNLSNWDSLYSACDRFNTQERTLILVTGSNRNVSEHQLKCLMLPNWHLVIDFDYRSENSGIFSAATKDVSVSPHKYKIADNVDNNSFSPYSNTHYHLFANNFEGSGEEEITDFNTWSRKYNRKLDAFVKSFSEVFAAQKVIVLAVFDSRRHLDSVFRTISQYFGDNTSFIFANYTGDDYHSLESDWHARKIDISIAEIAEGLNDYSSNFGVERMDLGKFIIPYMDKSESEASGELTPNEFAQYEEYFEVVHKGLPLETDQVEERTDFLRGVKKISWKGLSLGFDVQRKNFLKSYIRPLERVFDNSRGKVVLVHDAGFGGTTVARRIAWHFHNDYPTLILKNYKDSKVKELIVNLHQKTRKTIFVILEVPQVITLDEAENLFQNFPTTRPVVFLIVKRGKAKYTNELVVNDWGNDTVDLANVYRPYIEQIADLDVKARKLTELDKLLYSPEPVKKTPFYIGLLTFEKDFFAIKDYIKNFFVEFQSKPEQKKTLMYLALCQDYIAQGLPAFFFKKLFKVEDSQIFILEHYFPNDSSAVDSLLLSDEQGIHKFWSIKHSYLAKELKQQFLSGTSDNPEIWKEGLGDLCYDFIWDSKTESNISEYVLDVLQKLFIGNRRDRSGDSFTSLIYDIPEDHRERVFKALKDAYPVNPHFCSHLARYYAYHNKNQQLALKYADEAISLSIAEGYEDPLLYHIKGMCLRSNIYDIINRHLAIINTGEKINDEEYLEIIENLIPDCSEQFNLSRSLSKKANKTNEHGFVAHIQLLIRAIDYGVKKSGKSKAEFFKSNIDPFPEWLDQAESLLEEVKRVNLNDDESGKIEDCVNDILDFYEDYGQILMNLRNQLDKGINPARARRQIVRTYVRNDAQYYTDTKTVNNILMHMEDNIEFEPDNEKNFYLWFQAARHSKMTIDDAMTKMSKWKVNSNAIDATYYFYILKVIRALNGYSDAAQDAVKLVQECKQKGRSNTTIFEWLGKGDSLSKLIGRNQINASNKEEKLELVEGFFTDFVHDGSGKIIIADRLEVFFSPTQAKLTSNDQNQKVEFYLGFSYDGLRADSYSVRLKGSEPRNKENYELVTELVEVQDSVVTKVVDNRKSEVIIVNTSSTGETGNITRKKGKIVDMQKPPKYMYGFIEDEFGKSYIFHRNNEKAEVFDSLRINLMVTFEVVSTSKGVAACNIEIDE